MSAPRRRGGRLGGLVVKLTLIAALMMLAFGWLRATITTWAFEAFAIPAPSVTPDDAAHDALVAVMRDPDAQQRPEVADALAEYFAARRSRETLAFVLDLGGAIIARSPELDSVDDAELTAAPRYRLAIGGKVAGTVFSYVRPTYEDEQLQGFVNSMVYALDADRLTDEYYADAPILDLAADTDLALSPELLAAQDARRNQYTRISDGVLVGVAVITALLLGVVVSFLVTRRLRSLARAVEADADLPGPFPAKGRDEISRLAAALNDMRARVAGLVEDLRGKDQQRREWIAQVSHDLRTPLTSLTVCLDRARAELENAPHEASETLALAQHDLRRVRSFVDDLFEVARLEIGAPLHLEPIPPLELAHDAARSLQALAAHSGVALRVESRGELEDITGDGHRLLRACENLLGNAVRHARAEVRIGVQPFDGGARIYVADDGPGFAGGPGEVELTAIGRRSGQADSTGLGLLVARRVAEIHGGAITATNDVDGWTLVELQLPREPAGGDATGAV
ncbi:MAG: ATP-binding protein [Planctomycetota bacterium]